MLRFRNGPSALRLWLGVALALGAQGAPRSVLAVADDGPHTWYPWKTITDGVSSSVRCGSMWGSGHAWFVRFKNDTDKAVRVRYTLSGVTAPGDTTVKPHSIEQSLGEFYVVPGVPCTQEVSLHIRSVGPSGSTEPPAPTEPRGAQPGPRSMTTARASSPEQFSSAAGVYYRVSCRTVSGPENSSMAEWTVTVRNARRTSQRVGVQIVDPATRAPVPAGHADVGGAAIGGSASFTGPPVAVPCDGRHAPDIILDTKDTPRFHIRPTVPTVSGPRG